MGKLIGLFMETEDQSVYIFQKSKNLISVFLKSVIGKIHWINLYNSGLCYQIGAVRVMFKGGCTLQEKKERRWS